MVGIGKLSEAKKLFYDSKIKDDPRLNWKLPIFYFSLGLEEEAFEWMNQEATKNPSFVISMLIDPFYDPFRNDPRYKQVISKLNLPE
jgi:hypothetical protein